MTYTPTLDVITNGSIGFIILWVVLSVLFSIIIGSCTAKDTAAERCGHVQYVGNLVVGSAPHPTRCPPRFSSAAVVCLW